MNINIMENIIFLASFCAGLYGIYAFVVRPIGFFRKRHNKIEEEKIKKREEVISSKLSEEFKILVNDIYEKLSTEIKDLNSIAEKQNLIIELVKKSSMDIIASRIEKVYIDNSENKTLTLEIFEELELLYKDYKAYGGNGHIEKIYKRMLEWEESSKI